MKMNVTFSENTTNVGTEFAEDTKQIRTNFGKVHEVGGATPDAVLYTPQTLTDEQKAQARKNIGVDVFVVSVDEHLGNDVYTCHSTASEIYEALQNGKTVILDNTSSTSSGEIFNLSWSTPDVAYFVWFDTENYFVITFLVYNGYEAYRTRYEVPFYEDGRLSTLAPTEYYHAANKAYVDNAVKGKAYELIETITLEETAALDLTEEPDGTPYKFERVMVLCSIPAEGEGTPAEIKAKFPGTSYTAVIANWGALTSKGAYFGEMWEQNGYWRSKWAQGTNFFVWAESVVGYNRIVEAKRNNNCRYISGLKSNGMFRAGSVLKIYAVRYEGD